MKKRLKMRITTARQQIIVSTSEPLRLLCSACGREVEMLADIQAIRILGIDSRMLDQFIAVGQVHAVQTVNSNKWVCKDSLFLK